MPQSFEDALSYSQRWIDIIHKPAVTLEEGKEIIEESQFNFAKHFNKGWLEYRKSVTEAGDWAATEWTGCGALFRDVIGREYIDCLGGYGLLDLGWSHPEVVDNRARPAQPHAHAQPGADRPAARRAGPPAGSEITPGDIQYSFFCASGTEAVEGAIKLAKMYTGKPGFIAALKGFHGKTMGSLSMMGKADYRQPPGVLYGGPVYHVPFGDADAVERSWTPARKWASTSPRS
jgi:putrescine aminotransferase